MFSTFKAVIAINVLMQLILPIAFGQVQPLGKYNVDRAAITVSGCSSGAAMATQIHVAYSSVFSGVAILAGGPYWCSMGQVDAVIDCMSRPENIDVNVLIQQARLYETNGEINALRNVEDDQIFILSGTLDTTVAQGSNMKAQQFYLTLAVPDSNIKAVYNLSAAHTYPTIDYGNECDVSLPPFISRCDYYAAYELLNHFYGGNLLRPSGFVPLTGQFYEFDQSEFFYSTSPADSSMDTVGFVYVPSACVSGETQCKLHVAFHGCLQQRERLGDEFAMNTGYNEVGELNNIIILYPQTIGSLASPVNPEGCWDWWGYTVEYYATKNADQTLATWRMVEKLAY